MESGFKNQKSGVWACPPLKRLPCYALRMCRHHTVLSLSVLAGLQLMAPSACAKDSQILETLYRSEDELDHQLDSLQKSQLLLSRSLKQQAAAVKNQNYSHFDKKYARQEILKQIWLLQQKLKVLDQSSDDLARDSSETQEDIYKTQQNLDAVSTQIDQTQRALVEVKAAIRQTMEAEKDQK